MPSRLVWRRSATAFGLYSAAAFGFLATIVAARTLGVHDFGLFAIVMAATAFFQTLLDLTVEEAVTKYGFRYTTAGEWGKLRRLFVRALTFKGSGAVLAGLALAGLAPLAEHLFGVDGLALPLLIAAFLPLAQAPEGLAGVAPILHGRYDVRAYFLALSMVLRLGAIAIGAQFGLAETMLAIVLAQVVATTAVSTAGLVFFRRFPHAPVEPLTDDSGAIRRFVFASSLATGVISIRTSIAPLLVGLVSTPAQVAFYRAALAPQQGFYSLSAPARLVLLTEQTRDWEHGKHEAVFAGIRRYTLLAGALMAAALAPLLVFMPELIELVFSDAYLGATDAARIVLVAAALQFVFGWTKSFPISIGRPNLRLATHGIETAVLVPLTLVLGDRWGATGAAVALLIATGVFVAHWTVLFLRLRAEPWGIPPPREAVAR